MCHERFGLTKKPGSWNTLGCRAPYLEMEQSLQKDFFSTDTFNVKFSLIVE